jgi:small subunit ribosomal protein S6
MKVALLELNIVLYMGDDTLLALPGRQGRKSRRRWKEMQHSYEMMYIVRPDVDEETLQATRDKVAQTIKANKGEITDTDDMGKRRFAYEINHYREGYYTVVNFQADAEVIDELDYTIRINDNILRHLIINVDEKK